MSCFFSQIRDSKPELNCLFCQHPAQDHELGGGHLCIQHGCACPGFYAPFHSDAERNEWESVIVQQVALTEQPLFRSRRYVVRQLAVVEAETKFSV